MQTMEVISVNLWQILISLCNLLLLFLILKKFLYGPVKKLLQKRQDELDRQYEEASQIQKDAQAQKDAWDEKMSAAQQEADAILQSAAQKADRHSTQIMEQAHEKAEGIVRQAKTEAQLERERVRSQIRQEIVEVSSALAEQMLQREISAEDHKELIDSFIQEIGESSPAERP